MLSEGNSELPYISNNDGHRPQKVVLPTLNDIRNLV